MKIAIIGYGRMGRLIEGISKERGHEIVCIIDTDNTTDLNSPQFREADVAIEFSTPASAVDNIRAAFSAGVPIVVGTTGWTDALPEIREICNTGNGTLLFASNFSIGVNVFMAVNRYLAKVMNDMPEYTPSMTEIHHIHKIDHPSGTAITLANELIDRVNRIDRWEEPKCGKTSGVNTLSIGHVREGEVPGTHVITWDSAVDSITIRHEAKSRIGFASGAVKAAEWLNGKRGFFTIADMLSDMTHTKGLFI